MSGAGRVAGALVVGLVVAGYAAALRAYGVSHVGEEGLLLAQAWRTAHGQVPYVDFHTGYGPLYFALQARLVTAGGLEAVRWSLAAVHGATAAGVYALASVLVGPALAAVAVALEVAFLLAVAPSRGVPFHVPYPAWYVGPLALAVALLLAGRGARPGLRALAAGVAAGVAAAIKVNSGLFLAAAAAVAIVLEGPPGARAGRAGAGVLVLVAAGAVVLLAPTGLTVSTVVLLLPVIALAALGLRGTADDADAVPRLAALGAGFVAVAVAAYARPLAGLGAEHFARDVLLIGSNVIDVYVLPFPSPAAIGAAVGLAAFLTVARSRERRLVTLAAGAAMGLAVAHGAAAASGPAQALRLGSEQAAFVLLPLSLWGALAVLRERPQAAVLAITAVAVLAALQLYPRPDFEHLTQVLPAVLPLAVWLWQRAVHRLPLRPGVARAIVLALPALAAAGRFAPTVPVLAHLAAGRLEPVRVGAAALVIEPEGAAALRALAAAVEAVGARARPGEPVLAFPACSAVPFFAGRMPAGPHDYFYPGRPDRAEAAALVAGLAAAPPRVAVTCSAAGSDLARAWEYYPEVTAFLATRYRVALAEPPFTVHEVRE